MGWHKGLGCCQPNADTAGNLLSITPHTHLLGQHAGATANHTLLSRVNTARQLTKDGPLLSDALAHVNQKTLAIKTVHVVQSESHQSLVSSISHGHQVAEVNAHRLAVVHASLRCCQQCGGG
jgi:hypothetical protein